MASYRLPAPTSMAFYGRPRLPFARPKTLQTLETLQTPKTLKRPLQWLLIGFQRPHPWVERERETDSKTDIWPFASQACWVLGYLFPAELGGLLEGLEGLDCLEKPLRREKVPQQAQHAPHPAGKSHHKATAMAQGHPPAAAMASYRRSRLPFARPQDPPNRLLQTLQTLQKSAQLRREKVPQQAQHAPLPHAKATTRPQQWLKGTPRPQQWLLIGVKPSKPSNSSKSPPNSDAKGTPTGATPARKSDDKATGLRSKRPYVCLAVRLPLSLYSTPSN